MAAGRIRRTKVTPTLVVSTSTTVVSTTTQELNGLLSSVLIKTAATVDSSATTKVELIDQDGYTVFSKSGIAANTRDINLLTSDTRVPLSGSLTVTVTFSAAQSTSRATEIVFLTDRG